VNLTAVLLTGRLTGGVSCAAVQGGLLAVLIARQRRAPAVAYRVPVPSGAPARSSPDTRRPRWGGLGDDLVPVGELGTLHPGTLAYACGMGMYTGTITTN